MTEPKNIGIIVAMGKELKLLLPLIENIKTLEIDGYTLYSGILNGHNVTVMQCGIGKVNAAVGAVTLLNKFNIDVVINTGVAGGADKSVHVMDVVFGESIAYHDVWCGPGTDYGVASKCPKYFKSADEYLNLVDFTKDASIRKGLICSGDKFIADIKEVEFIKSKFPETLAVDMESASIAQVCYQRNVDFLCVRVISDSPGASKNNIAQYDDFWEDAPEHIFNILKDILEKIN